MKITRFRLYRLFKFYPFCYVYLLRALVLPDRQTDGPGRFSRVLAGMSSVFSQLRISASGSV